MGLHSDFERDLIQKNSYDCVVGIDEVGRGSWAGPVAVGGYIFTMEDDEVEGVNDSKLIRKDKRISIHALLKNYKHRIIYRDIDEIDSIGIGKSIQNCIIEIIESVYSEFYNPFFIVDGQFSIDFGKNVLKRNKADSTFYSVAAASILAKVERDTRMVELNKLYSNYFFDSNVGYPTRKHIDALQKYGPSQVHRKSFKPIRELALRLI